MRDRTDAFVRSSPPSVEPRSDQRFDPVVVERMVDPVAGWLGVNEGRLLYRLAAAADPAGCIVEIGSWHGKSTIWLATGARAGRGAHVVAIDPHTGTHLRPPGETTELVLRSNLERAGVADRTEIIVATAEEAAVSWSRPVSLLWIDGDHEYESVSRDLELWAPYLQPGSVVALHDTFVMPGPERVVHEQMIRTGRFTSFVHADTTTAACRCGRLRRRDAVARRVGLARRALYGIRLRAYDTNRYGFATVRDLLVRN